MFLCSFLSPIWPFTALHRLYSFLDPFRLLFSTVLFLILEQPLNQPLNSYLSTILLFYSFFPLKKKSPTFLENLSYRILILYFYYFRSFPGGSVIKNLPANEGDVGPAPGWGRSPGEGNGNPLQYSYPEISMGWRAWRATVHGVAKSWTQLSNWTTETLTMILFIIYKSDHTTTLLKT